ncbi:SubName: Full=Uncharacterized protein {ECO:0000313/EMBL:CCA71077.1} [Serendipita indica DSM 11827]|nr:SubName: Full=Uncharacterized protein {ECO:0000313/EMBL:CCA71077.1} [Serendipita indica DSM 11827]
MHLRVLRVQQSLANGSILAGLSPTGYVRRYATQNTRRNEAKPAQPDTTEQKASMFPSGRQPKISMALGIAMMVCGLAGWIYYPKVADFENKKLEEIKNRRPEGVPPQYPTSTVEREAQKHNEVKSE